MSTLLLAYVAATLFISTAILQTLHHGEPGRGLDPASRRSLVLLMISGTRADQGRSWGRSVRMHLASGNKKWYI